MAKWASSWLGSFALAAAAAFAAAGCTSSSTATSVSGASAAPTISAIAGSPSGPISPDPTQPESFASLPTPATSAIGCQSGVIAIANVWYAPDSYLCVHRGARIEVTLFNYPSGWSQLLVQPDRAAKVTALKTEPDGTQTATITLTKATAFTVATNSVDHYAVSEDWTLHVTVQP